MQRSVRILDVCEEILRKGAASVRSTVVLPRYDRPTGPQVLRQIVRVSELFSYKGVAGAACESEWIIGQTNIQGAERRVQQH